MKKVLAILLVFVMGATFLVGTTSCNGDSPVQDTYVPPQGGTGVESPGGTNVSPAPAPAPAPASPEPPPPPPPSTISISAEELSEIFFDDDIVLIGVINPAGEADPNSNAANPLFDSYLIWSNNYLGANPEAFNPNQSFFRSPLSEIENLLSRAGITADSKVIVYSSDMLQQGSFFLWYLRMMGLDARFLDGGVAAWRSFGGATGNSRRLSEQDVRNSFRSPNYDPASFDATLEMVIEAAQNPNEWVIIDTRATAEFSGETVVGGSYGPGRIKGSVHIDWIRNLDPANPAEGQLIPEAQLRELYGFIGDRKVIAY